MRGWIVLCVVLVVPRGCCFRSPASVPDGDGTVLYAAVDAGEGTNSPIDGLAQWRNHTVRIESSSVHEIAELSSAMGRSQTVDLRRQPPAVLHARSDDGPAGRRPLRREPDLASQPFTAPWARSQAENSDRLEGRPSLTWDERVLIYSSFPQGTTSVDLWYATRSSATAELGPPTLVPGVNTLGLELDPVLSGDGCELYFASNRKGDGKLHVFHAQVAK